LGWLEKKMPTALAIDELVAQPSRLWNTGGTPVLRIKRSRVRRMPRGARMRRNLKRFFRGQRREVLALIERNKAVTTRTTKGVERVFVVLEKWLTHNASRELQDELWNNRPVVELQVAEEGRAVLGRVGASDVVFSVRDPNVSKAIDSLVFKFGKRTNATTSKALGKALKELRAEIRAGLEAGEAISELTKRVQTVFDHASKFRAKRIAMTESSRAVHLGQQLGAEKSGVVVGKQWVASTDGCEACMALHGRQIGLDKSFEHHAEPGPYSETPFPPAHPNCRCDMIEIIGRARMVRRHLAKPCGTYESATMRASREAGGKLRQIDPKLKSVV